VQVDVGEVERHRAALGDLLGLVEAAPDEAASPERSGKTEGPPRSGRLDESRGKIKRLEALMNTNEH
jgi:hypothetical protein